MGNSFIITLTRDGIWYYDKILHLKHKLSLSSVFSVSHVCLYSQVRIKNNSFAANYIGYKLWHYCVHQRKTGKYRTCIRWCIWLCCIVISTGYTSSGVSTNCVFSDLFRQLYGSESWAVHRNLTFITGTRVTY